ncbi:MAG: ABC transporter ATP-binding protein [Spirochaetaceae bacterium]|jgi:iron complex transport system ATP-binding protein|nr:ABC transporter ATP-binding protein [Spirochaetaceae bacterium]
MKLLEVRDLSFSYDKMLVLKHIGFSLEAGAIYSILGSNGAGKSTLLGCLEGGLTPQKGSVMIDGGDLTRLSPGERARKIGFVAQSQTLPFDFLVRDYLVLGRAPHIGTFKTPGAGEYRIVDEVMAEMNIEYLASKSILRISGGERQQVQIARALVQEPRLILMDEPANHLDYGNQIKILKLIIDLAKRGIAVVLTTHVPDHAMLLGGKTGILDREGYLTTGETEKIITEENLKLIYQTELRMAYMEPVNRMVCAACNIR